MKEWADKYKDPRWQRMRLDVYRKHGFKCSRCGDDKNELHVHHVNYPKGKEPWECSIYNLLPLCADCHDNVEALIRVTREVIAREGFTMASLFAALYFFHLRDAEDGSVQSCLDPLIDNLCTVFTAAHAIRKFGAIKESDAAIIQNAICKSQDQLGVLARFIEDSVEEEEPEYA